MSVKTIAAWAVHLFTASGLLAGFCGLLAAIEGDYRLAMFWMLLTLIIDGVDGTFARWLKVKEVLPGVSGKTIDYVIDFFTYAILPAYLFYVAIPLGPIPQMVGVGAILLSSALYYGIEDMVSEDGTHFVGFPVLWNVVLYIYIFLLPAWPGSLLLGLTLLIAILHFIPIRVPYPSRGGRFFVLTLVFTLLFISSAFINVWYFPNPHQLGKWLGFLAIAYFILLTILDTAAAWQKHES
ncbi:MAG: phosphatidylcholine synthase [Bacteroidota bacterium]